MLRTSELTSLFLYAASSKALTAPIRDTLSLRNFCGTKPEDIKTEVARFENMILAEGARLKKEGKKGLEILPGVKSLLDSVSFGLRGCQS